MNYWHECVLEAFCEAGIQATDEQMEIVVGYVEGAHENYSMAMGYDVADRNFESEEKRELNNLKKSIKQKEDWECSTKPCEVCTTSGWTVDGWGRDTRCWNCDGKGRV